MVVLLAGKVNGYYIKINKDNKTKSVYVTSDTVIHKKVINNIIDKQVDILIANMGGVNKGIKFGIMTLSANMLFKLCSIIKPKIILPVYYETFEHYKEPISEIKKI